MIISDISFFIMKSLLIILPNNFVYDVIEYDDTHNLINWLF